MEALHWSSQRPGERVLRIWLGATFTYAGVEKLADPGFLTKGGSTYIGTQIDGFAQGSPIGPLLHLAGHAPVLAGVAVAVTEILIGLATLAGVAPSVAAATGALLSTTLWLSASWHVHPYFLGSDSIYAVAWLAYLLSLPGPRRALGELRERLRERRRLATQHEEDAHEDPLMVVGADPADELEPEVAPAVIRADARVNDPEGSTDEEPTDEPSEAPAATGTLRRGVLRGGAVVAGGIALAGVAGAVGHSRRDDSTAGAHGADPARAAAAPIARVADVGTDGVDFTAPNGDPAVLVPLAGADPRAFSRVCTHSGCTASYQAADRLIVCPCHGSRFDPNLRGAPVNGPATRPLTELPLEVDQATGEIRLA